MIKLTKIVWLITLFGFMAVLLFSYTYLPTQVIISEDERGIAEMIIEKEFYFYYSFGLFLGFNAFLLMLGGVILGLPSAFLPIPKRKFWGKNSSTRHELKIRFKNWLKGFGLAFNIYAMLVLGTIYDVNDKDYVFQYGLVSYLVAGFLVIWLVFFFYLFNNTEDVENKLN